MALETTATTAAAGLKKDGTPKAKRGEGKGAQPRPAYVIYEAPVDAEGKFTGELNILEVTRKPDILLSRIDEAQSKNQVLKYKKVMI